MDKNETFHNYIAEYDENEDLLENKPSKFDQVVYVIMKVCEVITAIGDAMEGAQQIYTAKDDFKTVRNMAKTKRIQSETSRIQSEIKKKKAVYRQQRVEDRIKKR